MIHSSCDQKEELKMNKEKTLKIINRLQLILDSKKSTPEYEVAKLYINTWVKGQLKTIEEKINGNELVTYYSPRKTYAQLFQEFMCLYFCLRIDSKIKIYAIAVLFDFETRDLIIELYKQLFDKEQRNIDSHLRGYIDFNDLSKESQFEVIRHNYTRMGAC